MEASLTLIVLGSSLLIGLGIALVCEPLLSVWDELASRRVSDFAAQGRSVGLSDTAVRSGMRVWGLALLALPLSLIGLARAPLLLPVTGWLLYQTPPWVLSALIGRRRRRLRDQLVPVCFTLANASRSSLSLSQGIRLAADEAPEPLRSEMRRIGWEYGHGRSLSQALSDAAERLDLRGFRMLAAALTTCLEHGGPVTETLDHLSQAVQENQRLELRMDSLSAGARLSVATMSVFPAIFLVVNGLIEPDSTRRMLTTIPGHLLLTTIILLTVISVRWGMRITRFEAIV